MTTLFKPQRLFSVEDEISGQQMMIWKEAVVAYY
jgi:hypothetical protein